MISVVPPSRRFSPAAATGFSPPPTTHHHLDQTRIAGAARSAPPVNPGRLVNMVDSPTLVACELWGM